MIYYLEDDEQIRNLTLYTLAQTGKETVGFSRASELYDALETALPDLFLLDVMLPGEDGLSVLKNLRSNPKTADIPIMMITAKSTEFDKVTGLDAGADDYLSKPFGMMELVSRINALLRRYSKSSSSQNSTITNNLSGQDTMSATGAISASSSIRSGSNYPSPCAAASIYPDGISNEILDAGPIHLDTARYSVTVNGNKVNLTRKEFEMLHYLLENKGIVISRNKLLNRVWGYSVAGQTRTVDAHIQTLRKKLSEVDPAASAMIETIRGVGYRIKD